MFFFKWQILNIWLREKTKLKFDALGCFFLFSRSHVPKLTNDVGIEIINKQTKMEENKNKRRLSLFFSLFMDRFRHLLNFFTPTAVQNIYILINYIEIEIVIYVQTIDTGYDFIEWVCCCCCWNMNNNKTKNTILKIRTLKINANIVGWMGGWWKNVEIYLFFSLFLSICYRGKYSESSVPSISLSIIISIYIYLNSIFSSLYIIL